MPRPTCLLMIVLLLVTGLACGSGEGEPDRGYLPTDTADDDDSDVAADDDDDDDDNDDNTDKPWCEFEDCALPETYHSFALSLLNQGRVACGDVDADSSFFEVLGIGDVQAGRGGRVIEYSIDQTREMGSYTKKQITFSDPVIGSFRAYLYLPTTGASPHPAILMTHGHGSSAAETWKVGGLELAQEGVVVLAQDVAGLNVGDDPLTIADEPESSWWIHPFHLVPYGFSTYGLMVYQTTLMLDFLESLDDVEPNRIGAWGHSGGSFLSCNMLGLDDRVKLAVSDHDTRFPIPEEGDQFGNPWDERIPRLYCWGDGERLDAMQGDKLHHSYAYGYPDWDETAAVADGVAALTQPANCGDGYCGPGDSVTNCPDECDPSGGSPDFVKSTNGIPHAQNDYASIESRVAWWYWENRAPVSPPALKTTIRSITNLNNHNNHLDCLPNVVGFSEEEFHGYRMVTRKLCFGEAGGVESVVLEPAEPESRGKNVILWMSSRADYYSAIDEDALAHQLLAGGWTILTLQPLVADLAHDPQSSVQEMQLFGVPIQGIYLWQLGAVLDGFIKEMGERPEAIMAYGNEAGALTSVLATVLDNRIDAVATSLCWPVREPELDDELFVFHQADYVMDFALLGTKRHVLAGLDSRPLLVFDRGTEASEAIVRFFQESVDGK